MTIWEKPVTHRELLDRAWKQIELGVNQRKHPFHSPVFSTIDETGPASRTVILRRFWREPARLAFHSHIGSRKIAQIEANKNINWHFYHPEEKFQLRIKGAATIHRDDELSDEQWLSTLPFSRRCYVAVAPSLISEIPTHGMPEELVGREPTAEESEVGRDNFCVISTSIDYIDFLELDFRGNRRSFFDWTGQQPVTGWLTP